MEETPGIYQHHSPVGQRDRLDSPALPAVVEGPVLDVSRLDALRQMGADALPLVDRIIVSFLAGAPTLLAAVRGAVESGDPSELARVAHKFRGNAANLGAARVSDICRELEQRGRDRSTRDSRELLASLQDALDDTMVRLREQLRPAATVRAPR